MNKFEKRALAKRVYRALVKSAAMPSPRILKDINRKLGPMQKAPQAEAERKQAPQAEAERKRVLQAGYDRKQARPVPTENTNKLEQLSEIDILPPASTYNLFSPIRWVPPMPLRGVYQESPNTTPNMNNSTIAPGVK